jgi:hypothetical protein
MADNGQFNQVLIEIRQLREDMREDVNTLHDKIDHKTESIEGKIESQRKCLAGKLDKKQETMDKKLDTRWFKNAMYLIVLLFFAIGGTTVWNKTEIRAVGATVKEYQDSSSEKFKDMKTDIAGNHSSIHEMRKELQQQSEVTQKLIINNGGNNEPEQERGHTEETQHIFR